MKKLVLQLSLLLLPFFALAQGDAPVLNEFGKNVWGITTSFKLNDHVWIIQTQTDKDAFELAAIDDKMQVLWRNNFEGYPLGAGKFKDHILAVSASKWLRVKGQVLGPYNAVLVDEKTGETKSQKIIYDGQPDTQEFPDCYFNTDGSSFTFLIRQSQQGKVMFGSPTKLNTISALTIVKLDDNLSPTVSKLKFPNEEVISADCNYKGDLFLATRPKNEKIIRVTKYDAPKYETQQDIVQNIDVHSESDIIAKRGGFLVSTSNSNAFYMALMHTNQNKDEQLTVSKFDFGAHAVVTANEVFNKVHINELEKTYVPINNELNKPDINGPKGLRVKHITEWLGTLIVVMSNYEMAWYVDAGRGGGIAGTSREGSMIINGYDVNLKSKFQQLMPEYINRGGTTLATHGDNNILYTLANTSDGSKLVGLYGKLDLSNGKWLKLQKLSKENLDRKASLIHDVLWFAGSYIIPYYYYGMTTTSISLQLNTY